MAAIDGMLLEIENYTKNAEIVKNMVINRLVKDKIITKKQGETYVNGLDISLIKRSWFQKFLSGEKDSWVYRFLEWNNSSDLKEKSKENNLK